MLAPGQIVLIDSRRQYELSMVDEMEVIWLKVPRPTIERRLSDHQRYLGLPLQTKAGTGFIASRMLAACAATSNSLGPLEGRRFEGAFIDIVASAFLHQSESTDAFPRVYTNRVFARVEQFIDANLDDPELAPSTIAEAVGLSQRYLRKLFAARGATLMSFVKTRRLDRCRHAIGEGRCSSIAEAAYAHGFNNIASFNRSFKAAFGETPGDVRRKRS